MTKQKVVNMITTYNEKENIQAMVETLEKIGENEPNYEFITMIVDSHSPDGTGELVRNLAKKHKNLFLLETPRGLGISLINGYKHAISELKADIVIPNDCDFQWDPVLIPEMLRKLEEGYDVAVASRHVKGGSDNFSGFRKLTHFVSNTAFNYYWAGIHESKDLAGNFKAIRVKDVLDKVDLDRLNVRGFVIQSTMIYELSKKKAKFIEVPAKFKDRRAGTSKVGLNKQFFKDILETVKNSTRIRFERSPKLLKFFKFGIVGGIGFVINFVLFRVFKIVFKSLPFDISVINWVANALAAEAAIINNFIWNNAWTFAKEKISSPVQIVSKFIQFNLSSFVSGILIPSTAIGVLTRLFGDKYSSIYFVVAVFGLTIPLNWMIYNKVIWKKK